MKIVETKLKFNGTFTSRSSTKYIVLHHALAVNCSMADIHRWHLSRGWLGSGYHFLVRKNGVIETGRPIHVRGAHTKGSNDISVGICFEGDYHNEDKVMPEEQMIAGQELIKMISDIYNGVEVMGHRDLMASECPGQHFPFEQFKNIQPAVPFGDIEGHWGQEAIEHCYRKGYVKGRDKNKFQPDAWITRAEICAILYNFDKKK